MKIRNNLRFSSWVLLAGLCASLVLAGGLPEGWGWENGPLESFQAVTVLVGLGMAWLAAWQQRGMVASKIWCVAAVVWLAMLGHELAWGAVFWPPQGMGVASEPLYKASALWGQPAVVGVCAAMLLVCAVWVVRFQLVQRVWLRWLGERAMPWGSLLVCVLALLLSALAAGRGPWALPQVVGTSLLVMQEMAECWAYLALCWGQWLLVQHTQTWRASGYLQTMHFSLNSLGEGFD